jgi:hypothetical protein
MKARRMRRVREDVPPLDGRAEVDRLAVASGYAIQGFGRHPAASFGELYDMGRRLLRIG